MFSSQIKFRKVTVGLLTMAFLSHSSAEETVSVVPSTRVSSGAQSRAANAPAQSGPVKSGSTPSATALIEGFTQPYADLDLAASEMGTLAKISVKEGDRVSVGQLLANLDDDVLRASLEVARAGMQSEGELQSATTQLELRKVESKKLSELHSRNHASQQELDRVSGEVRLAEARILTVREELNVRRLEVSRIEAQLKQRQIFSPIDGVVVDIRKDAGEFLSPSDPVVLRVVQLDPLLVVFSMPVEHRGQLNVGQTVPMQIGNGPAVGTVEHVSPTADASSGTFRVKVRLPNPEQRWHGGEKSVLLLGSADASRLASSLKSPKFEQ